MLGNSVRTDAGNITHTLNGDNIPSLKRALDLAEAAEVDIDLLIKSIKNKK